MFMKLLFMPTFSSIRDNAYFVVVGVLKEMAFVRVRHMFWGTIREMLVSVTVSVQLAFSFLSIGFCVCYNGCIRYK